MGSAGSLTTCCLEIVQCHPLWTAALLLLALSYIRRYIRESYRVDGFNDKYVLITGCDSGFGHLLARNLDAKGLHVFAACLTESGAADVAAATSSRLKTIVMNVTDSESIRAGVDFIRKEVGDKGLWGLVNNAGRSTPTGPTDWLQLEDFKKILDVNLTGVIEVTLQTLPLLKKARGRVVNVASIFGRVSMAGGGYCLSKTGVESFSDSLRIDMNPYGINVCIIEPGFFKTAVTQHDLIEVSTRRLWDGLPEEVKAAYGHTFIDEYLKAQEWSLNLFCSADISKVTTAMEHALTARYPRKRYSVGWDAQLFWIPLSYFPSCVTDTVASFFLPPMNPKK